MKFEGAVLVIRDRFLSVVFQMFFGGVEYPGTGTNSYVRMETLGLAACMHTVRT